MLLIGEVIERHVKRRPPWSPRYAVVSVQYDLGPDDRVHRVCTFSVGDPSEAAPSSGTDAEWTCVVPPGARMRGFFVLFDETARVINLKTVEGEQPRAVPQ